jgi:hypothetical protein
MSLPVSPAVNDQLKQPLFSLFHPKGLTMDVSYQEQCPDCHVGVGELHEPNCDVERCPYCGHQLLFYMCCDAAAKCNNGVPDKDRIPWNGYWPGTLDCQRLGWAAKAVSGGWRSCSPDDPDAQPDMNRLLVEAKWDPTHKHFVSWAEFLKAEASQTHNSNT